MSPNRSSCRELYDFPRYYDVAFSWDLTTEIEFLARLFRRHVPFPVRHILEPACGTGRFLVALPRFGYRVTGYDTNPRMLAYARRRVRTCGIADQARALRADMRDARFRTKFDAALNSINSLGYLLSDADVLAHLRATAAALKPGGIYIIHLCCEHERIPGRDTKGWVSERRGVRVHTYWDTSRQDRRCRLSFQACRMRIDDHGHRFTLTSHHLQRLWRYAELRAIIRQSGRFRLAAVYSDAYRRRPLGTVITGAMGNHYYVLKAGRTGRPAPR